MNLYDKGKFYQVYIAEEGEGKKQFSVPYDSESAGDEQPTNKDGDNEGDDVDHKGKLDREHGETPGDSAKGADLARSYTVRRNVDSKADLEKQKEVGNIYLSEGIEEAIRKEIELAQGDAPRDATLRKVLQE